MDEKNTSPAAAPWSSLVQRAQQKPWEYSFLGLMRHIAATNNPKRIPIGEAQRPAQESFRLGQHPSLAFAPREIAEVSEHADKLVLRLFSLGMLGPNGPLPLHYTEQVRERVESSIHDTTLMDFLDMFHHRYFTHFYRAWAQSQSTAGLDNPDAEGFSDYIARLGGDEVEQTSEHRLPRHARWASVAHRVREARNPEGLVHTLQHYFGIPVALQEFQFHWIALDQHDYTELGVPRMSSLLGEGAIAGEMMPDRQTRFRLVLGPLNLAQYMRFTPQSLENETNSQAGRDLPALIEWVRAFVGYEYAWEVELVVDSNEAPTSVLGGSDKLGWTSWLGDPTQHQSLHEITGMIFEPESYVQSLRLDQGISKKTHLQ
ncbi:type VI secretion system baseplate subunit TssG [Comamonas composti]|uniref:type VI secretion system baseplate subunit TssG n=1 Tax=Comamonas composti TaxID=408558 RepID=UPI00047A14AE|nr:type VI secretion system baseplate subunit TssG [Comamonas composti]